MKTFQILQEVNSMVFFPRLSFYIKYKYIYGRLLRITHTAELDTSRGE